MAMADLGVREMWCGRSGFSPLTDRRKAYARHILSAQLDPEPRKYKFRLSLTYLHSFVTGYMVENGAGLGCSLSAPRPDWIGMLDQHQ